MLSPNNSLKGVVNLIFMVSIFLGFTITLGIILFNYAQVAYAVTPLNTTTNNITLDLSATNNTETFSRAPVNISVYFLNTSAIAPCNGSCIQFVTLWFSNSSANKTTGYNLTNDTTRSNTTHQWFYNNTVVYINSLFDAANNRGQFRNITFSWFNLTTNVTEWMNNTASHEPFNFSVNEFGSQERSLTVNNPTSAQNNSNYTVRSPFVVNVTSNQTFASAWAFLNGTTGGGGGIRLIVVGSQNLTAQNGSQLIWNDNFYGLFQNLTVMVNDSYGNTSWANTSLTLYPRYFRVDTINPILGPIYARVFNVSHNSVYKSDYNDTLINQTISVTVSVNGNTSSWYQILPNLTYPDYAAFQIYNISNQSHLIAPSNYTLANRTHVNISRFAEGLNGTYNITYMRIPNVGRDVMPAGTFINITFNVADNSSAINASVLIVDSNNRTQEVKASRMTGTNGTNSTFTVNITSNATALTLPPGRLWISPTAQDDRAGASAATTGVTNGTNQTFVMMNLYTGRVNVVTWYFNHSLANITMQAPNMTRASLYTSVIPFKNFTTFTPGLTTFAGTRVNESMNATIISVNANITIFQPWNGGGGESIRANQTLHSRGWNLVGIRSIFRLNTTLYASNNATYGNLTSDENINVTDRSQNVTYVSFVNSSLKYCTARRGFSISSCSPHFNVSDIDVPEGSGLWILTNANLTVNITEMGPIR